MTASRTVTHIGWTLQNEVRSQAPRVDAGVMVAWRRPWARWALERLDDLAHPDLGGVPGQLVAAAGATGADAPGPPRAG